MELLTRLRVNSSHTWFKTVGKALRSVWYKEKLEAIDKNLSRARENLNLSLLLYMEYVYGTLPTSMLL